MKKLLYLLIALTTLAACEKDDSGSSLDGAWLLQGYWDYPDCPEQNSWKEDGYSVWEFKSGTLSKSNSTGTYTVEGDQLTTNFSNTKKTFEMKLEDDKLVLTSKVYPHSATSGYSSCRHLYKYIFIRTKSTGGSSNKPDSNADNALSSLSGKTIYLYDQNVKVAISGSSCSVSYIRDSGVSIMNGAPRFSYVKSEKNKAKFTLSYKTSSTIPGTVNYSSNLSLTLDFIDKTGGTYYGSNNYSFTGTYPDSGSSSVSGLFDLK